MLQVKVFKVTEVEALNEFIKTVILSGNIHINQDGAFVVFYYPMEFGIDKSGLIDSLSKSLMKLQTERAEWELERRYWEGKEFTPHKGDALGLAGAKQIADKIAPARAEIERLDTQIKIIKQLKAEIEKGEYQY